MPAMNFLEAFIPSIALALGASAQSLPVEQVRYDGQTVVRATLRSIADLRTMEAISPDRWTCGPGNELGQADYLVARDDLALLRSAGIPYEVVIENVQQLIDDEKVELDSPFQPRAFFDTFPTANEVEAFMNTLAATYPAFVTRITLGQSLQGRPIKGFRLTSPVPAVGGSPRKPVIVLNSLQHAREWITVTTNLYIASQLLLSYGLADSSVRTILDRYEIVFVPIMNPDGYEITWTSNRFWRKNARTISPPLTLAGVDLNRNWGVGWGLSSGSSNAWNNETYRGTARFSEPETQALSNYMLSIPKLVAHVDIHSYASDVLRPWSYQYLTPPGLPAFDRIGQAMIAAIKAKTNITYKYGGPEILYLASGTAPDWSFGTTGSISFTIEMRSSSGGFAPSSTTIIPTGMDGLVAITAMIQSLCPADLNRDNSVDDTDFQLFVLAYDQMTTNAADFTGDGMTDDSDFGIFASAYDKFTCP